MMSLTITLNSQDVGLGVRAFRMSRAPTPNSSAGHTLFRTEEENTMTQCWGSGV